MIVLMSAGKIVFVAIWGVGFSLGFAYLGARLARPLVRQTKSWQQKHGIRDENGRKIK
jgi:hypothetical protein